MKRSSHRNSLYIWMLFWGMSIIFPCHVLGQQPLEEPEVFQSDLRKWYDSSPERIKDTELIVFSPFVLIDPALEEVDPIKAQKAVSFLTDLVPAPRAVFTSTGRTIYDVYKIILDNRAPEIWQLTKYGRRRLRKARGTLLHNKCVFLRLLDKLTGKSPPIKRSHGYETYLEFSSKIAALRTQLLKEADPLRRAELASAIQTTEDLWIKKGNKKKIDEALKDFREVIAKDPERFWADAETRASRNARMVNGRPLPITQLVPGVSLWEQSDKWTPWQHGNSSGLALFVPVNRKWLKMDILTTYDWAWREGAYKLNNVSISDGHGLATQNPNKQLMQFLPIQLLVTKNVSYNGQQVANGEPVIVGLVCTILPKLPAK